MAKKRQRGWIEMLERPEKGSIWDMLENPQKGSLMDVLLGNVHDSSDTRHNGKPRKLLSVGLQKKLIARAKGLCENCNTELYNKKIEIHHKNYDPADNRETNLMVLCKTCHVKLTGPPPIR